MSGRIVLFGATGYTGELTARSLVRAGASPVLVARSAERVAALASELGGLDHAVADVASPDSLRPLVEKGDVLVSTVGPFLKWGEPAVRTAAEKGAWYLDSTGEGPFIREVFERWGPVAASNGSGLVSAFGFDFVPGNLAAGLAMEEAGEQATAVDVGYFARSFGTSGGTRASIAGMMLSDAFAYSGGQLRTSRAGSSSRSFDVGGRTLNGAGIPGSELIALPASYPQLRDVRVFLGVPPSASRAMNAATLLSTPVRRSKTLRQLGERAVGKVVKGSTGGPDEAQRAKARVTIVAEARSAAGDVLSTVTLQGNDPYEFTADILAWGAIQASEQGMLATGGLGPIGAFGLDALTKGCAEVGLVRD